MRLISHSSLARFGAKNPVAASLGWLTGSCAILLGAILTRLPPALAQSIELDGSTDSFISIDPACNSSCTIGSNATGADHYFHSFRDFEVISGATVTFDAPNGIERIYARVTGSDAAVIGGTLQVGGSADLFLLAPEGVNVLSSGQIISGGSFIASTARSLEFATGSFGTQAVAAPPLLTIGDLPLGLRFVDNSRDIEVEGNSSSPSLWQSSGAGTLALLGGKRGTTFIADRTVNAYDGGLAIAAVGPTNLLPLSATGTGYVFDFSSLPPNNASDVELENVEIRAASATATGDLALYGREIELESTTAFVSPPANSPVSGNPVSGNIVIRALELELEDGSSLITETQAATGGAITIEAGEIDLDERDEDNDIIVQAPSDRLSLSVNPDPTPNFDAALFGRGNGLNDVGFIQVGQSEVASGSEAIPGAIAGESPAGASTSTAMTMPAQVPSEPPFLVVETSEAPNVDKAPESIEADVLLPLSSRSVTEVRGDAEDEAALSGLGAREQSYAIASLCEARQSSPLLSASGGGGVAAPPSGLAISGTSLADLGDIDVDATISVFGGTAAGVKVLTPAPIVKAEATDWQRGAEGQIQLVALSRVLPVSRIAIRCDA